MKNNKRKQVKNKTKIYITTKSTKQTNNQKKHTLKQNN